MTGSCNVPDIALWKKTELVSPPPATSGLWERTFLKVTHILREIRRDTLKFFYLNPTCHFCNKILIQVSVYTLNNEDGFFNLHYIIIYHLQILNKCLTTDFICNILFVSGQCHPQVKASEWTNQWSVIQQPNCVFTIHRCLMWLPQTCVIQQYPVNQWVLCDSPPEY